MKLYLRSIPFNDQIYFFNSVLGCLLSRPKSEYQEITKQVPEKISEVLRHVHKPYTLYPQAKTVLKKNEINIFVKTYVQMLVFFCKHSFFIARLFATIRMPVFNNSAEAIAAFRVCTQDKNQSDLCLPRSLFAASTSKKFKKSGAILIGVFLPSTSMHAWVIEDNCQPDFYDDAWINFQPVAIFFYAK